jgi:glutamate-1-semialdehyde 2,1-aminomutase
VTHDRSEALFARASAVTPGGVNSPVRAFRAVGGTPRFIRSASGARLTDVDGQEYVDLVGSWGPMLLGHAHAEVMAAVREALARGTSYGAPTEAEVDLAEEIVGRTPVDQVRLVSSGTEATMSAVRLARGFTGRDVVVKFAGCYHGHADALLASAGSGLTTLAVPGTPGVPETATALTRVLPYNDADAVAAVFAEEGDQIACVITEAAAGNMGVIPPEPGFNQLLARTCADHGALFVSDEVMTGFRASRLGQWGLDGAVEGWAPDLMTFGKVMGGGFPAAAFGGRADVMAMLSPVGPVYQAGTLSGNPLATAAGLSVLRRLDDDVYGELERRSARLEAGLAPFGRVQRVGAMLTLFTGPERVTRFVEHDRERYGQLFRGLLDRGVYVAPSQYECLFPSLAHGDEEIEATIEAVSDFCEAGNG